MYDCDNCFKQSSGKQNRLLKIDVITYYIINNLHLTHLMITLSLVGSLVSDPKILVSVSNILDSQTKQLRILHSNCQASVNDLI